MNSKTPVDEALTTSSHPAPPFRGGRLSVPIALAVVFRVGLVSNPTE